MTKKTIGFIGVGLTGHGMAKNILEKGWPLLVMGHRNRAPVDDLVARDAREAATPKAMAANLATATGSANLIGNIVKNYFATAEALGKGEDYAPMLSDHVAAMNGVSLAGGAPMHAPVRKIGER